MTRQEAEKAHNKAWRRLSSAYRKLRNATAENFMLYSDAVIIARHTEMVTYYQLLNAIRTEV